MSSPRLFAGMLVIPIALFFLAVGCGYDEGNDLPAVVERATPAGATPFGGCGGSSGLIESPSHECTYLVRGDAAGVMSAVAHALSEQGFDVSCRGDETTVEIAGLRGEVRVRAEITAGGSLTDDGEGVVNVFDEGYVPSRAKPIPRGSVALSLEASRQSEASANSQMKWIAGGFSCSGTVLREQTLNGCVLAWNGPGNEANRRLVVRRMRVAVAYVLLRPDGPGVSSGCFFGVLAPAGRYLIFESSWRSGSLSFEEPELGYSSQKGLDANARVRPDGALVLKKPSLDDRCGTWWNGPAGWEIRNLAERRRLAGEIEAHYADGENPRCTFTLHAEGTYLRVVADFNDGKWAWTKLTPVRPRPTFRPNGELAASGWLSVGP